jgi:AcrR family transcriptional regulator
MSTAKPTDAASSSRLHWVKPPQQARSQATLERLLDAAEEIITDAGVAALTVSEVVKRGGSSVGAFYARFPDKDALLATLHQRSCQEALATAELALDPARWEVSAFDAVLSEIVDFTVRLCDERRRLLIAFIALATADPRYAERRAALEKETARLVHRLFASREDEVTHPDLQTASKVAIRIVLSTLEYGALMHHSTTDDNDLSQDRMAIELTRVLTAYLGSPVSHRRPHAGG